MSQPTSPVMRTLAPALLILWLDSKDGATVRNTGGHPASDGDAVATWRDKAGTPQDALAQTGHPTYDLHGGPFGQPVIDFSTLPVANLVTGSVQARTIVMVHRWDKTSSGTPAYLLDLRPGIPNSYVWQVNFGGNWTVYVGDSTSPTSSIWDVRTGEWQITTFLGSSNASNPMHIFSRYTNNEFGLGKMAEIRVYDTPLSQAERLEIVGELQQKWFVPEPTTLGLAFVGVVGLAVRRRRR